MADKLVTYFSRNSPAGKEWMGFIYFDEKRLNIYFTAPTEDDVKTKMKEFYAQDKEKRDANRAKKAEARARKQKESA